MKTMREVCQYHTYSVLMPHGINGAMVCEECRREAFHKHDTRKLGDTLAVRDLKLGDTVSLGDGGAYMCATVRRIEEINGKPARVYLDRPYATHSDFSYTGGVIVTFGVEECVYRMESHVTFKLLQKGGYIR